MDPFRRFCAWAAIGTLTSWGIAPLRAVSEDESQTAGQQPVAVALDGDVVFERVVVGADGVARVEGTVVGSTAGPGERVIYSNTLGIHTMNFPSNQPVSDDIATTAPNGCALTRYRFKVLGKVLPTGATGAYTVTYALYTSCPLSVPSTTQRNLLLIPGTEGVLAFPDDGPRLIEHVVPTGTPVALPTNVYLSLRFNRGNCGTVLGAPAMVGYTGDIWDFPGFPCNGFLGGFPDLPHASFWAEFLAAEDCADAFVAYKTERPAGGTALPGANIQAVDDVQLIVDDCRMVGYEVAVRGVGFYSFELRRTCDGAAIEGTQRTFSVNASTVPLLQVARFSFDPPIALGDDQLYLGFQSSSNTGGAVVAGIEPIIGDSGSDYFLHGVNGCEPVLPTQGVFGAVNFAITCAGQLPTGACCDPYLTECAGGTDEGKRCLTSADCAAPGTCEAVCRDTTELNCPFPPRGQDLRPTWQAGKACDPDPFGNNPCGVAACCHKRVSPQNPNLLDEICENLTKNECEAAPPLDESREWQLGQYCNVVAQFCPTPPDCIAAEGSCFVAHPTPGCSDPVCCSEVCAQGSAGAYCCNVAWDSGCVAFAEIYCAHPIDEDKCAGALAIPIPGSRASNNVRATTSETEPGFCCHTGVGECIGGNDPGSPCVVASDCPATSTPPPKCTPSTPMPGAKGYGTIWFKWVQPAGLTSAGINTCSSNSPALDSIVQVFRATNNAFPQAECESLVPVACNDDSASCGSTQRNSRLCLRDLTPGATYYLMLAAKTPNRQGQYIVTISTSCSGETEPCKNCPIGEMAFVDPPSGLVDSRRPSPPNHPEMAEGIQTITALVPIWATKDCWSICESPAAPASIQIASVEESPPGTYSIHLSRPISPGAVTILNYTDKDGQAMSGWFTAHSANVNADSQSNPKDILYLIDYLNGVGPLAWGKYSGDLDHSGVIGPADIITLIDLLNGNGFATWNGTILPQAEGCP